MRQIHLNLMALLLGVCFVALSPAPAAAQPASCPRAPEVFNPPVADLLQQLAETPAPLLAAMDDYSVAMEACYDSPLGPVEMAAFVQQSRALADKMMALRAQAEADVRGNEFDFEDLLSSQKWNDIESLRVASAYAAAWGALSSAVRNISANEKRKALRAARETLQKLTFEFKHPVLVQRSMYGLAVAHIENGNVASARDTLGRLISSLQRNGMPEFLAAVQGFYDEISAAGYQPPLPPELAAGDGVDAVDADSSLTFSATGLSGDAAIEAALKAIAELRPPDEIATILQPAFGAGPDSLRRALDLIGRDKSLQRALSYQPGPALRQMRSGFDTQKYTVVREAWRGVKPFYPYMPIGLKRQIDYWMGVSLISLNELERALRHLRAAREGMSEGPESQRLDALMVLARLSADTSPDADLVALAQAHKTIPEVIPGQPHGMDYILAMRARIVLARDAANRKKWKTANDLLSGFGPETPAYQLFLGTRVRLLARAVADSAQQGRNLEARRKDANGGHVLYGLWLTSHCPPGCLSGNRLAVHRAAIELALKGNLESVKFGEAWGTFEAEGGDTRPLIPAALDYLVGQYDADRLVSLLNPADEDRAALVLGQWKQVLAQFDESGQLTSHYEFLDLWLDELQGRPRAALLEALITHDLGQDNPAKALALADTLAKEFPRRPNAWFLRAAALQASGRTLEAARALSSLARRTPPDDPVGMGARIGLSAIFIALEKADTACAMRAKTMSRVNAARHWKAALEAFPRLEQWDTRSRRQCTPS